MIFGVITILLFSVSATLKVCISIIAHKNLMSRVCFNFKFTNRYKAIRLVIIQFQPSNIKINITNDIIKGY